MRSGEHILTRLRGIGMLVLDVDGTLTDGTFYVGEEGHHMRRFSTRDGLAIRTLQSAGCRVGIISHSSQQQAIKIRAAMLGIEHCSVGAGRPKGEVVVEWSRALSVPLRSIAAMGDNVNDADMFSVCGLTICPADATFIIREQADIVLSNKGGGGCVKEWMDYYYLPAKEWQV